MLLLIRRGSPVNFIISKNKIHNSKIYVSRLRVYQYLLSVINSIESPGSCVKNAVCPTSPPEFIPYSMSRYVQARQLNSLVEFFLKNKELLLFTLQETDKKAKFAGSLMATQAGTQKQQQNDVGTESEHKSKSEQEQADDTQFFEQLNCCMSNLMLNSFQYCQLF